MSASFGVNLRVTAHCSRGGRKYMEDFFSVAYQESETEKDLEYAFIGIYDGHGGSEAAKFARQHLINMIVSQRLFWSDDDDDVLQAIREGYIATHYAMWRDQETWPKTAAGMLSTAGTTASVAFIRHGKVYIGHCGDSGIVLGYADDADDRNWRATSLTIDHKPESVVEKTRIQRAGGKVIVKSGVPRVVWNRPKPGHKGPVRRSTPIDEIPFLAVARSLGDFWSYNTALNKFVVSPDPDVRVIKINPEKFRCLIFGTDGLWNVISANSAVEIVRHAEQINNQTTYAGNDMDWTNPSKCLVDKALEQWSTTRMRADNTSVVIIMIDPPGPPKREVLRNSPQQFLVENEAYVSGTAGENQTPQVLVNPNSNCTLFDHNVSKTLIDLAPSAKPLRPLVVNPVLEVPHHVTAAESNLISAAATHSPIPFGYTFDANGDALTSSLPYEYAYAAAFNPLIHPMTCDPIEPTASTSSAYSCFNESGTDDMEAAASEDTYSLTCLDTRSTGSSSSSAVLLSADSGATTEHYHSSYDQPSTSVAAASAAVASMHSLHYEPTVDYFSAAATDHRLPHYESISHSSFLSQSCGIMQPALDDSVQTALMNNIPAEPRTPCATSAAPSHDDTMETEDDCIDDYLENYCSPCPSFNAETAVTVAASSGGGPTKSGQCLTTESTPTPPMASQMASLLDASIQINEITSSSPKQKENIVVASADVTTAVAHSTPAAVGYRIPMALRSAKGSAMRMTRSSKLPRTPSFDSRTKKPKTISKKSVAHKSPKGPVDISIIPSRVSGRRSIHSDLTMAKPDGVKPARRSDAIVAISPSMSADVHNAAAPCKRSLRSRDSLVAAFNRLASPREILPMARLSTTSSNARPVAAGGSPAPPSSSSSNNISNAGRETRTARLRDRVKSQYQLLQQTRSKSLVRQLSSSARKLVTAVASVAPSPGGGAQAVRTRGASSRSTASAALLSLSCLRSAGNGFGGTMRKQQQPSGGGSSSSASSSSALPASVGKKSTSKASLVSASARSRFRKRLTR